MITSDREISGHERRLVGRRKGQHRLLDGVVLLELAFHPAQPHSQAGFHVVACHIDRGNEVEPIRADVLQVQVGDPINVREFQ